MLQAGAGGYTKTHETAGNPAPVTGYQSPGFRNWPLGHILQTPVTNALVRSQAPATKTDTVAQAAKPPL